MEEKRFAVFGYGYNPRIPTCFVFAMGIVDAWEKAKSALDGRTFVLNVVESPLFDELTTLMSL